MAEIYLIGSDIYFRSNTSTWQNLGSSNEGKQAIALFRSAFSLDSDGAAQVISDTARMQAITDDPEGCRLYSFTQYTPEGKKVGIQMCVKDDLPTRLVSQTESGNVIITYKDFNQPIDILPPTTK